MTAVILKLECIGDDTVQMFRMWNRIGEQVQTATGVDNPFRGGGPPSPWVAEITGHDPKYTYARKFLRGRKDYSEANGVGSRGVHLYFELEESCLYQVYEKISWGSSRRYFARVVSGQLIEMSDDEAKLWISASTRHTTS